MFRRIAYIVRYCILGIAAFARIEAMKAANVERALRGDSPAYGELHFHQVEQDLEHYAAQLQKVL